MTAHRNHTGLFLTFEGIDFSGKSTQCSLLVEWLRERGERVVLLREPGGTAVSEMIRKLLLDPAHGNMDSVTELFLFSAARSQLVTDTIIPALNSGAIVVADRFFDSTTAYQGYGRGLPLDAIARMHELAVHGTMPRRTYFIDLDTDACYRRRAMAGRAPDRMEESDWAFFERVRNGYHAIAASDTERVLVVDGALDVQTIQQRIRDDVTKILASED